jgi:hypothetical protein
MAAMAGSSWYSAPVASTPTPTLPTQSSTPVWLRSACRMSCALSSSASVK